MLKVRVLRTARASGTVGASLVFASGVAGSIGCTTDPPAPQRELLARAVAPLNAGSSVLTFQPTASGSYAVSLLSATPDEFVRVGQSVAIDVPAWVAWDALHPSDAFPSTDARLAQLSATAKLAFYDRATLLSTATAKTRKLVGTGYGAALDSNEVLVPPKTDLLRVTLTIRDAGSPASVVTLIAGPEDVTVFGGELPDKSLLFDNTGSTLRARVVEQGHVLSGSQLTIGYSDWRADQVVDKTSLNTQIGTATFNGRFGPYVAPIYGKLGYQIAYAASLDGGATFAPEAPLAADTASPLLGAGRTAYRAALAIPATTTQLLLYFHVRVTLVADYSGVVNVNTKWYADGQVLMLKDVYDNPSGAYTNYQFPVDVP